MIRFILNIIRAIISLYLCVYVILFAFFMVNKKIYNDKFPLLFGYSYFKVQGDALEPNYVDDSYVLVYHDETTEVKKGDFVVYLHDGLYPKMKQVEEANEYLLTINYPNDEEGNVIDVGDVLAVAIYSNDKVSNVLNILLHPITLIVLVVAVVLLPELTYRRY